MDMTLLELAERIGQAVLDLTVGDVFFVLLIVTVGLACISFVENYRR